MSERTHQSEKGKTMKRVSLVGLVLLSSTCNSHPGVEASLGEMQRGFTALAEGM